VPVTTGWTDPAAGRALGFARRIERKSDLTAMQDTTGRNSLYELLQKRRRAAI